MFPKKSQKTRQIAHFIHKNMIYDRILSSTNLWSNIHSYKNTNINIGIPRT